MRFAPCLLLGLFTLSLAATPPKAPRKESWSRSARTRWVKGIFLGPGAVVPPGTDFRTEDLRNLDLTGATLDGVDLRGARLQGTDLSGALLGGARIGGAHWDGATLFRASSFDYFHFTAKGARLLPFFETLAHDPVGKVSELVLLGEDEPEGELRVVVAPSGTLIWKTARSRYVTMVAPNGMEIINRSAGLKPLDESKDELFPAHFCLDSHLQLWSPIGALGGFAQELPGLLKDPKAECSEGTWYDCNAMAQGAPVKGVIADAKRGVWTFGDGWMARHIVGMPPAARKILSHTVGLPGMRPGALAALEDGRVAFLDEGKDWVGILSSKTKKVDRLPLFPGSRASSLAVIAGEEAVVSCPGLRRVDMIDLGGHRDPHPVEILDEDGTPLEPGQVTVGSDGNVWVMVKGEACLVRISVTNYPERFPLPDGMIPKAFIGAHNGCLLFTVEGDRSVGSMRVLPPEAPADSCASSSSWSHAAPQARPTLLSNRLAQREQRRAEAALRRTLAEATPEAEEEREEEKDGKEEKRVPAPRPAPAPRYSASQRLVRLGVLLGPGGVKKVLDFHGCGMMEDKSQFAERFSSEAGLAGLLAEALEDCEMGRVRTAFDSRGYELTPCRRKGVGWVSNWGRWVPTDRFLVITRCRLDRGRWVQEVVNAYPISETW
jgi:hypothetical protein